MTPKSDQFLSSFLAKGQAALVALAQITLATCWARAQTTPPTATAPYTLSVFAQGTATNTRPDSSQSRPPPDGGSQHGSSWSP